MKTMPKSITIISVVSLIVFLACQNAVVPPAGKADAGPSPHSPAEMSVIHQDTSDHQATKSLEFLNVLSLDSTIIVDMPYADTANFTHHQIYACAMCELRPEVANALAKANALARSRGYCIKVFDCYRPSSAQRKMYDAVPDKRYVADPAKGSKHSSGCAVDVTLCKAEIELDMGTPFDDFTTKSHLDYRGLDKEQQQNRALLLEIMKASGFSEYTNEWWHFNFIGCSHPQDDHHWECK